MLFRNKSKSSLSPIVIWVSGRGAEGKSTVGELLGKRRIPLFDIDEFVLRLHRWYDDPYLYEKMVEFLPMRIGCFLRQLVDEGKQELLLELFFNPQHGFQSKSPICAIVGYMPYPLQRRIVAELEARGAYVWLAARPEQLDFVMQNGKWY